MGEFNTKFFVTAILLVALGAGFIVYYFHASSIMSSQDTTIANYQKQVAGLQSQVATLQAQVSALQSGLAAAKVGLTIIANP